MFVNTPVKLGISTAAFRAPMLLSDVDFNLRAAMVSLISPG